MWAARHGGKQSSHFSREAAKECSPRRKPWAKRAGNNQASEGRKKICARLLSSYSWNVTTDSTTLYRPVGQKELDLVRASGYREFPPRLPEQPFFHPVLNEDYATRIARDWNTKDESCGLAGYVLRFSVRNEFLNRYEIHVVGDSTHREYWIPSTELVDLNTNIVGSIEVISEFRRKK